MRTKTKKSNNRKVSTKRISEKRLSRYANLTYNTVITEDHEEGNLYYIAQAPELPGLIATGETIEEAKADFELAKVDYIEALLKMGISVPLPTPTVNIITFLSGSVPENIATVEPIKPLRLNFDLSKVQAMIDAQPRELAPGIYVEFATAAPQVEFDSQYKLPLAHVTSGSMAESSNLVLHS